MRDGKYLNLLVKPNLTLACALTLIILMLLHPMLTDVPLVLTDVLVVAAMGLVCFVPFGLFLREVSRKQVGHSGLF